MSSNEKKSGSWEIQDHHCERCILSFQEETRKPEDHSVLARNDSHSWCADEGLIIGVGNPAPMVIPVSIRKDEQGNWQACPEYWGLFLYRDETGKTEYEFGRLGVRITR